MSPPDVQTAFEVVHEANGSFVRLVLDTIEESTLGDEARKTSLKAIRKIILREHNETLRRIKGQLRIGR